MAENGLTNNTGNGQPTDSRTLKALNAYMENRNQSARMRVAEVISGIDLYV